MSGLQVKLIDGITRFYQRFSAKHRSPPKMPEIQLQRDCLRIHLIDQLSAQRDTRLPDELRATLNEVVALFNSERPQ
jgi:hypothetical protein